MNRIMLRNAVHISSIFAFYLATMMLLPALVDLYYSSPDWQVFAASAAGVGGISALLAIATRAGPPVVSTRFTFLVVNMLWLTFSVCAALPFYLSTLKLSVADSFFESVSAVTATGATVLSGLDSMPPGILLWRSVLQWIGGLGVIVLGLFILPFLKIGVSSFFKIESSDRYDRPFARFSTYASSIVLIYTALTIVCAILYAAFGMTGFDAINHAMTTLATGGMSTHDNSFAYFNDSIHWVAIVFMLIGAMPFTIIIVMALKSRFDSFKDFQVLIFLAYTFFFSIVVAVQLTSSGVMVGSQAVAHATFNVVSIITTTGYSNNNYMLWGPFTAGMMLIATFMGGCSGSTSGGIKASRWIVLIGIVSRSLEKFVYPNAVRPVRSGAMAITDQIQFVTLMYFCTFGLLVGLGTMLIALSGADLVTAFSGAITAVSNVGPGLGDIIGPAGNFGPLADSAKWVLSFLMLLGRLEIFTMLVLLSPVFWRK